MASPTMTLIQSVTVPSGGASSIDFTSIPSTYTDLQVVISTRIAEPSVYSDGIGLTVNSGSSYTTIELYNQNSTANSYGPRTGTSYLFIGHAPSVSSTSNTFGSTQIYIPNYTSTGVKSVSIDGTTENNGTQIYQVLYAGKITNGAAINSITIDGLTQTFVQYSTAYLYGIRNS